MVGKVVDLAAGVTAPPTDTDFVEGTASPQSGGGLSVTLLLVGLSEGSSRSAGSGRTRELPRSSYPDQSARFQGGDEEPASGTSSVDQLLEGQTRSRPKVTEMTLDGARPDAHQLGGVLDGSASSYVSGEHVHLSRRPRW